MWARFLLVTFNSPTRSPSQVMVTMAMEDSRTKAVAGDDDEYAGRLDGIAKRSMKSRSGL
jgi:hypothetical protein